MNDSQTMQSLTAVFLLFAATACSDSDGTARDSEMSSTSSGGEGTSAGGDGNMTGTGGSAPGAGGSQSTPGNLVALMPDATGWVEGSTNVVGIQGAWYSYNDCANSPGDCTMNHLPPEGSFENTNGKMCTSGTTAVVATEEEFSTKWGAGIALDLNNSGGTDGMKMPYDADAAGVVGFSFTITGTAPGLRVNFTSVPAGDNAHFVAGIVGENTPFFEDAMQGSWVTSKVNLDTTQLLAIQFQIPSALNKAVAFDFCVENLAAVTP